MHKEIGVIKYKQIEMENLLYQGERKLRNEILLRPIGIPDHGWEMYDSDSFHFAALDGECIVGCVVLYPLPDCTGDAQLMQMAVTDKLRGQGIGRDLVNLLLHFARSHGYSRVVCHSRGNVVHFYEKLGFVTFDEPFTEVNILHRKMFFKLK